MAAAVTTAIEIQAGWSHTCAVPADATVRCSGNPGAMADKFEPIAVTARFS